MIALLAATLAAGPLPVIRIDGFEFKNWHIDCDGLRYTPSCRATHPYGRNCLSMYFHDSEAYVELIPRCDGSRTGRRRPLVLPLNSWDQAVSESIQALLASDHQGGRPLSSQFLEDAEIVGALLNKITNEPAR